MEAVYYTDGACSGVGGCGGWCFVELLISDMNIKSSIVTGNSEETTNNIMELTAVYKALVKAYRQKVKKVTIYSDSAYVVNAIKKEWLKNWYYSDWRTKEGNHVKNQAIWEKIYKLIYEKNIDVTMIKVTGHKGDTLNELADRCAVNAKLALMEGEQ